MRWSQHCLEMDAPVSQCHQERCQHNLAVQGAIEMKTLLPCNACISCRVPSGEMPPLPCNTECHHYHALKGAIEMEPALPCNTCIRFRVILKKSKSVTCMHLNWGQIYKYPTWLFQSKNEFTGSSLTETGENKERFKTDPIKEWPNDPLPPTLVWRQVKNTLSSPNLYTKVSVRSQV